MGRSFLAQDAVAKVLRRIKQPEESNMLKSFFIAVLPLLAAQGVLADATLASAQTAIPSAAQVMAMCEGPDALSRGEAPCATFWAQVQIGMTDCMADVSRARPAWHARYLTCAKEVRAGYVAVSQ